MKAQHNITQIAQLLGRGKSTNSRELHRNARCRGCRAKQACELACKRSESSRNASTLAPWVKEQASALLQPQWGPEQIAGKLPVSHESLYLHVYAYKAHGGTLWKNLRCQKQKRKRYASGRDRSGQIPIRRPLREPPAHIEGRQQVGHWECDTVIGANHKQAIVTVVERKSGYAVMLIDPWGEVLSVLPHGAGVVMGEMDPERLKSVRHNLQALKHRRLNSTATEM
jgi:IS30 family transposase